MDSSMPSKDRARADGFFPKPDAGFSPQEVCRHGRLTLAEESPGRAEQHRRSTSVMPGTGGVLKASARGRARRENATTNRASKPRAD